MTGNGSKLAEVGVVADVRATLVKDIASRCSVWLSCCSTEICRVIEWWFSNVDSGSTIDAMVDFHSRSSRILQ